MSFGLCCGLSLVVLVASSSQAPEAEDSTCLLQKKKQASQDSWSWPSSPCYPVSNQTEAPQAAGDSLGWWNMPDQDLSFSSQVPEFTDFPIFSFFTKFAKFSRVSAAEGAHLMFNATNVASVQKDVPEALRGVFWMRGNGIAEELTVLQYGKWYPESNTYISAFGPMVWSWPTGKPVNAPMKGYLYSDDSSQGATNAAYTSQGANAISYKFSTCPEYAKCSTWGNPLKNMSFANMQLHGSGKLKTVYNIGDLVSDTLKGGPKADTGAFAIEAETEAPGQIWRRSCRWGFNGNPACADTNLGSYDLVRILDGKGDEVTTGTGKDAVNHFKEFVDYMGDVEMIVWSGFKSESAKQTLASWYTR